MSDELLFDVPDGTFGAPGSGMRGADVPDTELMEVIAAVEGRGDLASRFGNVFRQSIDEILDGRRTKRYNFMSDKVSSVERSYLGAKAEIIARLEFDFGYGVDLDYLIAGHEVDAKFSGTGDWMIAPKNVGQICLVMQASEKTSNFSVGLVRANEGLLTPRATRDKKRTLSAAGKMSVQWLVKDAPYPKNQLMELWQADPAVVDSIFAASRSGQARVNELFLQMQEVVVNRTTVQTVAAQEDSSKRVRDARLDLRSKGIVIFGHQKLHQKFAEGLGLIAPQLGSWTSVQVCPAESDYCGPMFSIQGVSYRKATVDDSTCEAPLLPKVPD
ncbi:NaeI family type II restriction endonuclease [Streptomyces sp. NPDC002185]|uniref:NaeI family type II restriction endonuclease n=1 Tax=Streptomyces sp. NPDC002185 TaxID=3364636 RepID=UPI003687C0CD